MKTEVSIAVAVVGALNNLDVVLVLLLKAVQWSPLLVCSDLVFWDWGDVIHSLALAGDGWFHGLVDTAWNVLTWQLVATAVDEILGLSVELELADDSLDDVGFVIADFLVEVQVTDGSVLEFNVEFLLADFHWLIGELRAGELLVPSIGHLAVDLCRLAFSQLHDDIVAIERADGETGLHEHSGVLILQVREGSEGAGANLVDVFLVLVPCAIPATGGLGLFVLLLLMACLGSESYDCGKKLLFY